MMKKKAKAKKVMPDNMVMSILVDFCGGYVLPSPHCWQMLSWKKKKPATSISSPVSMYSKKK
ncbi:hypothetical protein [Kistimonas asteriae]|uniref:hypothetical protein n=1 Tax=Kistimonas asteriae TaxID=517724 RepID=UPI001BA4A95F|nr:hypothetical protein [Kistimonas asteriae]